MFVVVCAAAENATLRFEALSKYTRAPLQYLGFLSLTQDLEQRERERMEKGNFHLMPFPGQSGNRMWPKGGRGGGKANGPLVALCWWDIESLLWRRKEDGPLWYGVRLWASTVKDVPSTYLHSRYTYLTSSMKGRYFCSWHFEGARYSSTFFWSIGEILLEVSFTITITYLGETVGGILPSRCHLNLGDSITYWSDSSTYWSDSSTYWSNSITYSSDSDTYWSHYIIPVEWHQGCGRNTA